MTSFERVHARTVNGHECGCVQAYMGRKLMTFTRCARHYKRKDNSKIIEAAKNRREFEQDKFDMQVTASLTSGAMLYDILRP